MDHVLVLNSGSSSLKFAVYSFEWGAEVLVRGKITNQGFFTHNQSIHHPFPTQKEKLQTLFHWLKNQKDLPIEAVGHRFVHGGPKFNKPMKIEKGHLPLLQSLIPFDPLHLPQELEALDMALSFYPDAPHIACFDTAFHAHMPKVAKTLPLPKDFFEQGIQRYGFHGLSYEYVLEECLVKDKLIVAHLGSGSSLAAIRQGKSIDTTMGLTSTGGIPMVTRSGDLDPGVLFFLQEKNGLSSEELKRLLNRESGLKGLAGIDDVALMVEQRTQNTNYQLALDIFCYEIKKTIGAYRTILGGLKGLVFTGGIGEASPWIREKIVDGIEGIELKEENNLANAHHLTPERSPVQVYVIPANEELMIAKHTHRLLQPFHS